MSIEEMDTIRFREDVWGFSPLLRKDVQVDRGRDGIVIRKDQESGEYEIQVDDPDTGIPECFVTCRKELIYRS